MSSKIKTTIEEAVIHLEYLYKILEIIQRNMNVGENVNFYKDRIMSQLSNYKGYLKSGSKLEIQLQWHELLSITKDVDNFLEVLRSQTDDISKKLLSSQQRIITFWDRKLEEFNPDDETSTDTKFLKLLNNIDRKNPVEKAYKLLIPLRDELDKIINNSENTSMPETHRKKLFDYRYKVQIQSDNYYFFLDKQINSVSIKLSLNDIEHVFNIIKTNGSRTGNNISDSKKKLLLEYQKYIAQWTEARTRHVQKALKAAYNDSQIHDKYKSTKSFYSTNTKAPLPKKNMISKFLPQMNRFGEESFDDSDQSYT